MKIDEIINKVKNAGMEIRDISTNDGNFSLTWMVPNDIESGDYIINSTDGVNTSTTIMRII